MGATIEIHFYIRVLSIHFGFNTSLCIAKMDQKSLGREDFVQSYPSSITPYQFVHANSEAQKDTQSWPSCAQHLTVKR